MKHGLATSVGAALLGVLFLAAPPSGQNRNVQVGLCTALKDIDARWLGSPVREGL